MAEHPPRYTAAMHRMQSAVAYDIGATIRKHIQPNGQWILDRLLEVLVKDIRVGLNSQMASHGEFARLLIAKGVITQDEYLECMVVGAEREADLWETSVKEKWDLPDETRFA